MRLLNEKLLSENVEKAALYDIENGNVYGCSYIVKQCGKTIFKKHYGVTGENKKAVDDKTLFRLASMTKPITAVATLINVDRGLISLEDTVNSHIPQFKDKRVKILHLLSHTSGIADCNDGIVAKMTEKDKRTVLDTVNFFADKELAFTPMSTSAYSPFAAWDVLVAIIEKVTGEDFFDFIKREILDPLGMIDTAFVPNKEQWERFIDVNGKVDGKCVKINLNENCVFGDFPCTHNLGGAGLFSTLLDYSAFAETLLNNGLTQSGKRILNESTAKLIKTPVIESEEDMCFWGLGVRIVTDKNYPFLPLGIYGWSGAYGSHFWVDPENKITAVFMKNSGYDGGSANESAVRFEQAVNNSLI